RKYQKQGRNRTMKLNPTSKGKLKRERNKQRDSCVSHNPLRYRFLKVRPGQAPGLAPQPFGVLMPRPAPLKGLGKALTRGHVSHPSLERGPVFVPHRVREATSRTVMAASPRQRFLGPNAVANGYSD